ncbi:MAG: hypothetical protein ACIARR_09940 [Phycisphaerales bacterium JB059]
MDNSLLTVGAADEVIPILIITLIGAVVLTLIIFSNVRRVLETRARETTRREIAAYVAEGSIAPEDAQRLLANGSDELEKQIGNAVAWGMISAKKAEGLLRAAREGRPNAAPVES